MGIRKKLKTKCQWSSEQMPLHCLGLLKAWTTEQQLLTRAHAVPSVKYMETPYILHVVKNKGSEANFQ